MGDIGHAPADASADAAAFQHEPVCGDASLREGHVAKDRAHRVTLSLTFQAAQTDDLAGLHLEADSLDASRYGQVFDLQQRLAGRDIVAPGIDVLQHAAHHHADDLVLGNLLHLAHADQPAVLEHGDPVGQLEDFIQPV